MMNKAYVPLASIDETEDDVDYATVRCKFVTKPQSVSLAQENLFSPCSEELASAIHDSDEFADTGFFSESFSSSKRSSIDIDYASQFNSKFSNRFIDDKKNIDDDEELFEDFYSDAEEKDIDDEKVFSQISPEISCSLEDLVNSFDEKVKSCLRNYDECVENIAPVQVRSHEEVIRNRPAWWTLTGIYGNILPIDWAKVRPDELNLLTSVNYNCPPDDEDIDEAAEDVKLDQLIDSCLDIDSNIPIKTADEVLEEIDEIMSERMLQSLNIDQQSLTSDCSLSYDIPVVRRSSFYLFSLEKLKCLTVDQLQDLYEDLEDKVQKNSTCLIDELALRDELEFEKEVKNNFFTLLLKIQNKRKEYFQKEQLNCEENRSKRLRYLTTIIPYHRDRLPNNVPALQSLVKIMRAMIEDSPTVPTQLTDYILRFICPSGNITASATTTGLIDDEQNHSSALTKSLNSTFKAARLSFRNKLKFKTNRDRELQPFDTNVTVA